jgi:predicted hydrocarbon binding protein
LSSIEEESEIDVLDLLVTLNHFEYYHLSSLLAIMPYDETIKFIKEFKTNLMEGGDPQEQLNTLEELIDQINNNLRDWQTHDALASVFEDGKIVYKVRKCRWAEEMKNLDPGLSYAMRCYQDYAQTKFYNPNFVLTRTQTLTQGAEYCDFCYHDIRIVKEIIHPPTKFWEDYFLELENKLKR